MKRSDGKTKKRKKDRFRSHNLASTLSQIPIEEEAPGEEFFDAIENPLPLPKKHVHKQMDFGIQFQAEQLKFDVAIPDYDDFEL
ncbi:MAG: hypothetical protein LBM60_00100 [Clostridium sp.]|jgi:hypothetical protein|nr:hypothetical protein [Clostridium sp.]